MHKLGLWMVIVYLAINVLFLAAHFTQLSNPESALPFYPIMPLVSIINFTSPNFGLSNFLGDSILFGYITLNLINIIILWGLGVVINKIYEKVKSIKT